MQLTLKKAEDRAPDRPVSQVQFSVLNCKSVEPVKQLGRI